MSHERTQRLLERTGRLLDIPSVSRDEIAVLDLLATEVRSGERELVRADGVVALLPERRPDTPLVILAGHVDTVPPQGNEGSRLDGDVIHGVGATDMKGALAVIWEVLETLNAGPIDVAAVFFGREEIPITESALLPFLRSHDELGTASLAIVMEPTDNQLQLGCMGNLNATVTYGGDSAHSARPWLGRNAIHAAIRGLAGIAAHEERTVTVDDLVFREVVNVTMVDGGIAQNVLPSTVSAHVNLRYAPGRSGEDARAELTSLCGAEAQIQIISDAPSGPIPNGNPLVERLASKASGPVGPKQAWTPVAEFGLCGIDAVNFGPGDPRLAHRPDESVSGAALDVSAAALLAFLSDEDV